MSDAMKLCIDCKHCNKDNPMQHGSCFYRTCTRPGVSQRSPVSGVLSRACVRERSFLHGLLMGDCGPSARYFEASP